MAEEILPVVERIEVQFLADLVAYFAAFDIAAANIQRADELGGNEPADVSEDPDVPDFGPGWIVVSFDEEDHNTPLQEDEDGDVAIGCMNSALPFTLDLHLLTRPSEGEALRTWGNRWKARLMKAALNNFYVAETETGNDLAFNGVRILGSAGPIVVDKQRDILVSVEGEIRYRTAEADPYTVR